MKRKWFKTVALLMTLALLTGFAFAEQAPETANVELDTATQESAWEREPTRKRWMERRR